MNFGENHLDKSLLRKGVVSDENYLSIQIDKIIPFGDLNYIIG